MYSNGLYEKDQKLLKQGSNFQFNILYMNQHGLHAN